jgi:hypothetical protein
MRMDKVLVVAGLTVAAAAAAPTFSVFSYPTSAEQGVRIIGVSEHTFHVEMVT